MTTKLLVLTRRCLLLLGSSITLVSLILSLSLFVLPAYREPTNPKRMSSA